VPEKGLNDAGFAWWPSMVRNVAVRRVHWVLPDHPAAHPDSGVDL